MPKKEVRIAKKTKKALFLSRLSESHGRQLLRGAPKEI